MKMLNYFKLSADGKLTRAVSLALFSFPLYAENTSSIVPNNATNTQVTLQGQTPIVNIAAPDNGLSYNQFDSYNVTSAGAVLNNALEMSQSQILNQMLQANPNLTGDAASVILNEVMSNYASMLNGEQEILGQAADLILANPNGISCQGCSYINTNRASLVVGKVDFTNGLKFNTSKNNNRLSILGGGIRGANTLDLIAPSVNADGPVMAKNVVNAIAGSNQVKLGTVQGGDQDKVQVDKIESNIVGKPIDSYFLGGMVSGRINLVTTALGSGVNISGKVQTADLAVNAEGDVALKGAQLQGEVTDKESINNRVNIQANNVRTEGIISTSSSVTQDADNKDGFLKENKFGETRTSEQTIERTSIKGTNINIGARKDVLLSATKVQGGDVTIEGKSVAIDHQTLEETKARTDNNWFLAWRSDKNKEVTKQTVVGSEIGASNNVIITAKSGDLDITASSVNAGTNIQAQATQGNVNLQGASSLETTNITGYKKNDAASLTTGNWSESSKKETSTQSTLHSGGDTDVTAGNKLTINHANLNADHHLNLEGKEAVDIGVINTVSENTNAKDKTHWGGIGGGKNVDNRDTSNTANRSSITAGKTLAIDSDDKVTVQGALVKGREDATVRGSKVKIDGAITKDSQSVNSRTGTVFNITKDSEVTNNSQETSTSSELKSEHNLTIVGRDNVSVKGSSLEGKNQLEVSSSGNVDINSAEASSTIDSTTTKLSVNTYAKEKSDKQYAAGVRLEHDTNAEKTTKVEQNGSNLTGDNISIKSGKDVTVSGSNINAIDNVAISGKNVTVKDSQNTQDTTQTETKIGAGVYYTGGIDKLGNGVEGGLETTTEKINKNEASVSSIKAGGDISITANDTITNQGTDYQAGNNLTLDAKNIDNKAAVNTRTSTKDTVKAGVDIGVNVDYSNVTRPIEEGVKTVSAGGLTSIPSAIAETAGSIDTPNAGVDVNVEVVNGNETTSSTESKVTSLNAANITSKATESTRDQGTQYKAQEAVVVTTNTYTNTSAINSEKNSSDVTDGGGDLRVYTTTGFDGTVDAKANGGNTKTSNAKEIAVVSQIQAGKGITIDTNNASFEGVNINAGQGSANITASEGDVNFKQASNSESTSSVGYKANVGVKLGQSVEKSTMGGSLGGGYEDASKVTTTAVVSQIAGDKGINIEAKKDITLEGTKLTGGESSALGKVSIKAGNDVNLTQATDTQTESSAKYAGNIEVNQAKGQAKGTKSSSLGGKLGGTYDKSDKQATTGHAGQISGGQDIQITAGNDIKLEGTQLGTKDNLVGQVALEAGGNIDSGTVTSTSSSNGLKVEGSINATMGKANSDKEQTSNKGMGLDLSGNYVDESKTERQGSSINSASNVSIIAGGDKGIRLEGANISAKETTLEATNGVVTLESAQSQEHKNNVSANVNLSASGTKGHGKDEQKQVNLKDDKGQKQKGFGAGVEVDKKDATTHSNTKLNGETVNIKSKGDVTLSGANIDSNKVDILSTEGRLKVESRKDTELSTHVKVDADVTRNSKPGTSKLEQVDQFKDKGVNAISSVISGDDKKEAFKKKVNQRSNATKIKVADKYLSVKDDITDSYHKNADKLDQDRDNKAHDRPLWDKGAQTVGNKLNDSVVNAVVGKDDNQNDKNANIAVNVVDKDTVVSESGIKGTNGVTVRTQGTTELNGAKVESEKGLVDLGDNKVVSSDISGKNTSVNVELSTDVKGMGKEAIKDIKEGKIPLADVQIDNKVTTGGVINKKP